MSKWDFKKLIKIVSSTVLVCTAFFLCSMYYVYAEGDVKVIEQEGDVVYDDSEFGRAIEDFIEKERSNNKVTEIELKKEDYDIKKITEHDLSQIPNLISIRLDGYDEGIEIAPVMGMNNIRYIKVSNSMINDVRKIQQLKEITYSVKNAVNSYRVYKFINTNADYLSNNTIIDEDSSFYKKEYTQDELQEFIKTNIGKVINMVEDFRHKVPHAEITDIVNILEQYGEDRTSVCVRGEMLLKEGSLKELKEKLKTLPNSIAIEVVNNGYYGYGSVRYVEPALLYCFLETNKDVLSDGMDVDDFLNDEGAFAYLDNGGFYPEKEGKKSLTVGRYIHYTKESYELSGALERTIHDMYEKIESKQTDNVIKEKLLAKKEFYEKYNGEETKGYEELLEAINKVDEVTMEVERILNDEEDKESVSNESEQEKTHHAFVDVDQTRWSDPYINRAWMKDIISGYPDSTFRPTGELTGASWGKMLLVAGGYTFENGELYWFSKGEKCLYDEYLLKAEDEFDSSKDISREEVAVLAVRLIEKKRDKTIEIPDKEVLIESIKDYDEIDDQRKEDVLKAYTLNLFGGDKEGNFNPKAILTREQAAKVICEVMNNL